MEFFTLQDFIAHNKAIEYLMGVAFAIGFGFFWLALNRKPHKKESKEH